MSPVTLVRPDRQEVVADALSLAPRGPLPADATLTIIDNGKPNARRLMQLIADELSDELGLGAVELFVKPGASRPVEPDEARRIAASSSVVLAGLGDCGACSACSLHDAVQLEALGVPTALIITDPFQGLVTEFSGSLGLASPPSVCVPHPISSRDEAHLRRVARACAQAVRERLVGPLAA